MDAETIRDSVLLVSGLNQRGGPGFEDFAYKHAYAPEYTRYGGQSQTRGASTASWSAPPQLVHDHSRLPGPANHP